MTADALRATVLVTTYRRCTRLLGCLDGIRFQTRSPEEVLVVAHASDTETLGVVRELQAGWNQLRLEIVTEHGSVAALNRGLSAAAGDIVAIIDDDAVPAPDWLERILATYAADLRIAAVGGRDLVIEDGRIAGPPARRLPGQGASPHAVGQLRWFGRVLANHHIGTGPARDVDLLKGANMSLRRAPALNHGYDQRLRGTGAVVHTELSICLPLRKRGYRVVYDPAIVVRHYQEPRPHGDHRDQLDVVGPRAHNEALAILDRFGPLQRVAFAVWSLAVGNSEAPGFAVLLRDLLIRRPAAGPRFIAAQRGRAAAWRTRRTPRPLAPAALPIRGNSERSQVRPF